MKAFSCLLKTTKANYFCRDCRQLTPPDWLDHSNTIRRIRPSSLSNASVVKEENNNLSALVLLNASKEDKVTQDIKSSFLKYSEQQKGIVSIVIYCNIHSYMQLSNKYISIPAREMTLPVLKH